MDYQTLQSRNEELIEIIGRLSNCQRQLTSSALDFQSLIFATRHEKERAVEMADDLGKVLTFLIKSLKKEVCNLPEIVDNERPLPEKNDR